MVNPVISFLDHSLTTCARSDAKSVSIISQGCFHPVTKVQSASLHFFLGSEEMEESGDEDEVRSGIMIILGG
jgi:hypothetical protein